MAFLDETTVAAEVKRAIKNRTDARIAVAFWGGDAVTHLGLASVRKARLLCNLGSGCCNPTVIRQLKEMKGISVRTHDSLHAKVYLTSACAIVGSSNASTNGLAMDEVSSRSWREANLVTSDANDLSRLASWFEERWSESNQITKKRLEQADEAWKRRQRETRVRQLAQQQRSLLKAVVANPDAFEDLRVYFALYRDYADKRVGAAVKKKQASIIKGHSTPINGMPVERSWEAFQDWELPSNAWLIDCRVNKGQSKFWGLFKTAQPVLRVPYTFDGCKGEAWVAFRERSLSVDGAEFHLTPNDCKVIEAKAEQLWRLAGRSGKTDGRLLPLGGAVRLLNAT